MKRKKLDNQLSPFWHFLWHFVSLSSEVMRCILWLFQGSSARLVLPAILGKRRAWRVIQILYARLVILKVRNLLLCTVLRWPLYIIAPLPWSWDCKTWLNKPWYLILSLKSEYKRGLLQEFTVIFTERISQEQELKRKDWQKELSYLT